MASRPESMMIQGGPREYKKKAIDEARNAQDAIDKWASKDPNPHFGKYQFKELIGKGSYGRVYKSLEKATGQTVAIKVLTPDDADINIRADARDANLNDALKEISILERLRQSGAKNVNQFIEAFTLHSQLWLVSEYCSGGSLSTLKRAAGGGLSEKFIRAVARELAIGLASVHKAGIVHRDIKCANVMISETGSLQIIDFGVSAVMMSNMEEDKRKTIIGTPHWMAPELQQAPDKEVPHGSEVDVWAYGITLYEVAMGVPPNATVTQQARLRHLLRTQPPRLPEDRFSADLRDLVKYVLDPDAKARPTMPEVCRHPYILGSETEYPTSALKSLVETYYDWERTGGNRVSLWYGGGAAQAKFDNKQDQDEWVFSTTAAFDRMHDDSDDFDLSSSPPREADEYDEDPTVSRTLRADEGTKGSGNQGAEAIRGEKHLEGLFNQAANPYSMSGKSVSDLPLRSGDSGSSLHRKELSVSSNDEGTPNINLDAIDSKKKRVTMAWKWPSSTPATMDRRPSVQAQHDYSLGEPVTARPANPRQTLDLDALLSGGGTRESIRKTLDMDAMFQALPKTTRDSIRKTLDMDAMMNGGFVSRESIRKTLDLDSLLAGVSIEAATQPPLPQVPPVPPVPQNLPSHSQQPSFQDPRKTLDLDFYMGSNPPPMPDAPHPLGDPLSFEPPPESEQTMRPASQYPNQQSKAFEGHDFATAPSGQAQPLSLGDPVSHGRQPTFDFESLMAGGPDMLDEMMAGDHDYPSTHGPMTDDDRSSLASHDLSSLNMSATHSRNQSGSIGGLASSPPTSPFGQTFPDHSQHLPGLGLLPVPDYPTPVDPAALRDGVDKAIPAAEMKRLLAHFGGVLDVALSYLNEAERRAGTLHGIGTADDADTESIHGSVNGDDREREGTPGDDDALEMRHR